MFNMLAIIWVTIFKICIYTILAEDIVCNGWEPYKDEKCFKIYDETHLNYDDAIKTCVQQDNTGSIAIIGSKEEQDFITNFVFNTKKIADNVWIGIRNSSVKFARVDNLELSYTNWSPGSPQNESDYNCVQLIADKALSGKWINEPCIRKNAVLCEKLQLWSVSRLQKVLLEERRISQEKHSLEQKANLQLKNEINEMKQNPIPIGFIYVQLPGQNEPKLVWPTVKWEDVSSTYAGLFFRVLGGNSAAFEIEQIENDRYLQSVQYFLAETWYNGEIYLNGSWSAPFYSGDWSSSFAQNYAHQFKLTTGEVRPRNKAVKIWKRIV